MRTSKPKNTVQDVGKLVERLNTFFKGNIYLLAFGMVALSMLTMCSNSSFKDDAISKIEKHGLLLKENLGKVHFLTASGQHVVGERFEVGYEDERFQLYVKNIILDNLVQGLAELTKGFTLKFHNGEDIKAKNERFAYFENTFVTKNSPLLSLYRESLNRIVVEGRLPEYISLSDSRFSFYSIKKSLSGESGENSSPEIVAKLQAKVFIKSWIKELKVWDTREVVLNIPFKAIISVEQYANIGNPFGVMFKEIEIPTILKPKASDIAKFGRKK